MTQFNFNAYEKVMMNAMIQANATFDTDGGYLYFETRSLIRQSIWNRLENEGCTPYQCKQATDAAMQIVDKIVEIGLPIAA